MTIGKKINRGLRLLTIGTLLCSVMLMALAIQPDKASADICAVNGRNCYFGYFFNGYDGGPGKSQHNLFTPPQLGLYANNINDLTGMIGSRMSCQGNVLPNHNSQNASSAAFIVLTMLGAPPGTNKNVACQRYLEWFDLVHKYNAAGLIRYNQVHNFGGINTRSSGPDVTYYPMNGAAPSIVFYSPVNGAPLYAIKRDCGNPIGRLQALFLNYNLQPNVNVTVNGAASTGVAEAGDSITFNFRINNTTNMDSPVVNCSAKVVNHAGYFRTPAAPETGGTPIPASCPRSFPRNSSTQVASQTVTATANTTICRTLFVSPANPAGANRGTEVCVAVANKPYLMVFGGDVAAGGDVETAPDTCGRNPDAGVISWNKNVAGGFAGSGTQFAVLALGMIRDFSTAQGSPPGGAEKPTGLSFASTTQNVPAGNFGGDFGASKCIRDYYSQKPASTSALPPNISAMTTGAYSANSSVVLNGGNVNPGQRTTVYVDGDLFIGSNITYAGNWHYGNVPLFQVVVRGNIYISGSVTRLDGIYIAQPIGAAKGYVYTCATDATPPFTPLSLNNGAFYNSCTNKLTVNGSVVARSIQFLRTSGTLRNSNAAENRDVNNAAEEFNYGPAFWITQPDVRHNAGGGVVSDYDAITSLPPVL